MTNKISDHRARLRFPLILLAILAQLNLRANFPEARAFDRRQQG